MGIYLLIGIILVTLASIVITKYVSIGDLFEDRQNILEWIDFGISIVITIIVWPLMIIIAIIGAIRYFKK